MASGRRGDCFQRAAELAFAAASGTTITVAYIVNRYGCSNSQAKRDLLALEAYLPLERFTVEKDRGRYGAIRVPALRRIRL